MDISQEAILQILSTYIDEPFWEDEELNYKESILELLDFKGIQINEEDIQLLDEVDISTENSEQYRVLLSIPSLNITVQLYAVLEDNYVFTIKKVSTYTSDKKINPDDIKTKLKNRFETLASNEPFWETEKHNPKEAILEYIEFLLEQDFISDYGQPLFDERHIEVEKTTEYVTFSNEEIIESKMTIPSIGLKLIINAKESRKWEYTIEKTLPLVTAIKGVYDQLIVQVNNEECVVAAFECGAYGLSLYAVPLKVAEELNLMIYAGKEIRTDEDFLDEISKYDLPFISFHNYD